MEKLEPSPRVVVGCPHDFKTPDNPYLSELATSLFDEGVAYRRVRFSPLSILWARGRDGMKFVHVHWPEHLGFKRDTSTLRSLYNALIFVRCLAAALVCRLMHIEILWTVHNLQPHDSASRGARTMYGVLARISSARFAHTDFSARKAEAAFGWRSGSVVITPHGSYQGAHPESSLSSADARVRFGLGRDDFVVIAFGLLRPYKGLLELVHAFDALADDAVRLLIVGRAVDDTFGEKLTAAVRSSPRTVLAVGNVPDREVSDTFRCADLSILNYAEVFSSGVLLLSLTQGVPVLVPRGGSAREVASWPAIGEFDAVDQLAEVIEKLRSVPEAARRGAAIEAAELATWRRTALPIAHVVRSGTGGGSSI